MTANVQKMTEEQLEAFGAVLRADVKKKLHDALLHRLMNGATNAQMIAILPGENPHSLKNIINGLWGFDEIARVAAALNLGVEISFTLNGVQPPQLIVPPMTDEDVAKMSAQFNDPQKQKLLNEAMRELVEGKVAEAPKEKHVMGKDGVWHLEGRPPQKDENGFWTPVVKTSPTGGIDHQSVKQQIGDGLSADI